MIAITCFSFYVCFFLRAYRLCPRFISISVGICPSSGACSSRMTTPFSRSSAGKRSNWLNNSVPYLTVDIPKFAVLFSFRFPLCLGSGRNPLIFCPYNSPPHPHLAAIQFCKPLMRATVGPSIWISNASFKIGKRSAGAASVWCPPTIGR